MRGLVSVAITVSAALAFAACGDDTATGSGGSGGAGGSGTTTATTATQTTSTGMITCEPDLFEPSCGACLVGACCAEVAACQADAVCSGCFDGETEPECFEDEELSALFACTQASCYEECLADGPVVDPACDAPLVSPSNGACFTLGVDGPCNPISNEACDTAGGYACDRNTEGGYECFGPPNAVTLCEPCGPQAFCLPTLTCLESPDGTGRCAKFCCDDGDCGSGVCDLAALGDGVGVCVVSGA